jgi:hypothetical protein
MADTDTALAWASGWITMNLTVACTVVGDLATEWGRFAAVTIVQTVVVVARPRMLTNPRLHPTRCRLFRRVRALVAPDRINATLHKSSKQYPPMR